MRYHLTLASIFKYSGCYVLDSLEIAVLLKNFACDRSLQSQDIPQQSLPLVLSFLKGAPFKALEEAFLKDLTFSYCLGLLEML